MPVVSMSTPPDPPKQGLNDQGLNDQDVSDQKLVYSCLQGHPHSFRILYQRHQGTVRSTLYQLCGPSQLDDLVQEVFLRVWKGLKGFRQTAQFSTWIYRITWNVATDQRRRFGQERSRQERLMPVALDDNGASSGDPSGLNGIHYQDLVQRGLTRLSDDHRSVLVLHDLQDLPQKEIAEILSIPVGTVKSRLFHARSILKQFFQQEGVQL
jgi:RNA polymerase sigma-70 factor (ECF subfamily)